MAAVYSFILFYTVFVFFHEGWGLISDYKLCGDPECERMISRVQAQRDHVAKDCRFLSFKKGDMITVYYKLTGKRNDLWAGSMEKLSGLFPKDAIKVDQLFIDEKKEIRVPTQDFDFICFDENGLEIEHSIDLGDPEDLTQETQDTNFHEVQDKATVIEESEPRESSLQDVSDQNSPKTTEKGGSSWIDSTVNGWFGRNEQSNEEESSEESFKSRKIVMDIEENHEEEKTNSGAFGWIGSELTNAFGFGNKDVKTDTKNDDDASPQQSSWINMGRDVLGFREDTATQPEEENIEDRRFVKPGQNMDVVKNTIDTMENDDSPIDDIPSEKVEEQAGWYGNIYSRITNLYGEDQTKCDEDAGGKDSSSEEGSPGFATNIVNTETKETETSSQSIFSSVLNFPFQTDTVVKADEEKTTEEEDPGKEDFDEEQNNNEEQEEEMLIGIDEEDSEPIDIDVLSETITLKDSVGSDRTEHLEEEYKIKDNTNSQIIESKSAGNLNDVKSEILVQDLSDMQSGKEEEEKSVRDVNSGEERFNEKQKNNEDEIMINIDQKDLNSIETMTLEDSVESDSNKQEDEEYSAESQITENKSADNLNKKLLDREVEQDTRDMQSDEEKTEKEVNSEFLRQQIVKKDEMSDAHEKESISRDVDSITHSQTLPGETATLKDSAASDDVKEINSSFHESNGQKDDIKSANNTKDDVIQSQNDLTDSDNKLMQSLSDQGNLDAIMQKEIYYKISSDPETAADTSESDIQTDTELHYEKTQESNSTDTDSHIENDTISQSLNADLNQEPTIKALSEYNNEKQLEDIQSTSKENDDRILENNIELAMEKNDTQATGNYDLFTDRNDGLAMEKNGMLVKDRNDDLVMERADELTMDRKDELVMERTDELTMDRKDELVIDRTDELTMDRKDELIMDRKDELVTKKTDELTMDRKDELVMERTDELTMDRKDGLVMESTDELTMDRKDELVIDSTDELTMDRKDELVMDRKDELTMDRKDELIMDRKDELVMDRTDELTMDRKDELVMDRNDELVTERTDELTMDRKDELVMDRKDELTVDRKDELVTDRTNELTMDRKDELVMDIKDELVTKKTDELTMDRKDELVMDKKDELVMERTDELTMDRKDKLVTDRTNELTMDRKDELVMDKKDELVTKKTDELTMDRKNELVMDRKDELVMKKTDELTMDKKDELVMDRTDELTMDRKDDLVMDRKDELVTDRTNELTMDRKDDLVMDKKDELVTDRTNELTIDRKDKLVMDKIDKLVMDRTDELTMDRKDKFVMDRTDEIIMDRKDDLVTDRTDQLTMDRKDELVMDKKDELVKERTDELTMDRKDELITDRTDELTMDRKDELVMDRTDELVMERTNELTIDRKDELVMDRTDELPIDRQEELVMDQNDELVTDKTDELTMDRKVELVMNRTEALTMDRNDKLVTERTDEVVVDRNEAQLDKAVSNNTTFHEETLLDSEAPEKEMSDEHKLDININPLNEGPTHITKDEVAVISKENLHSGLESNSTQNTTDYEKDKISKSHMEMEKAGISIVKDTDSEIEQDEVESGTVSELSQNYSEIKNDTQKITETPKTNTETVLLNVSNRPDSKYGVHNLSSLKNEDTDDILNANHTEDPGGSTISTETKLDEKNVFSEKDPDQDDNTNIKHDQNQSIAHKKKTDSANNEDRQSDSGTVNRSEESDTGANHIQSEDSDTMAKSEDKEEQAGIPEIQDKNTFNHPTETPKEYTNLYPHLSEDNIQELLDLFGEHKLTWLDSKMGNMDTGISDDLDELSDLEQQLKFHMKLHAKLGYIQPKEYSALQKLFDLLSTLRGKYSSDISVESTGIDKNNCVHGACQDVNKDTAVSSKEVENNQDAKDRSDINDFSHPQNESVSKEKDILTNNANVEDVQTEEIRHQDWTSSEIKKTTSQNHALLYEEHFESPNGAWQILYQIAVFVEGTIYEIATIVDKGYYKNDKS